MLLVRLLRGEETLGVAFAVSLTALALFLAYDHTMRSLSETYRHYFECLPIGFLTFAVVCLHNCCAQAPPLPRFLARFSVLLLLATAVWLTYGLYGKSWAIGYIPLVTALAFVVRGEEGRV